jgi:methylated-DNA-[protein]-cysteine S-methyltransferase
LHANPIPIVVPCHRVVRTGGGLGGYGGTLPRKVALLKLEGALGEDG